MILGLGNEILKDDGIGPKIVGDLAKEYNQKNISFKSASLGGFDTIELLKGYHEVIIIDAIKTPDGIPGSLYILDFDNYKETAHISNLHDISFLDALKLGKRLNILLPEKLSILAVEIIEDMEFGENLTPELEKRYPGILNEIRQFLNHHFN